VIAVLNEALATELVCTVQISRRIRFNNGQENPSAELSDGLRMDVLSLRWPKRRRTRRLGLSMLEEVNVG